METQSKHRITGLQQPIAFSEMRQRATNMSLFTATFTTKKPWIYREKTNLENRQRAGEREANGEQEDEAEDDEDADEDADEDDDEMAVMKP